MPDTAQRRVLIDVTALDLWPDGRCVIGATWAIVDIVTRRAVAYGGGTFNSPPIGNITVSGDAGLVDAISQTVGKLADAIALDIRQSANGRLCGLIEDQMQVAIISAMAAIVGSSVGAIATFATTWLVQNSQLQSQRLGLRTGQT